jgi:DNA polymerase-3 subunit alpha
MIHLRVHSHYSLLTALPKIDRLVKTAKNLNMSALALTDNNNMYGAIEFVKECKKNGIKPIVGCEVKIRSHEKDYPLVLIAKSFTGYQNLMQLVSIANTKNIHNTHPFLTFEDLGFVSNSTKTPLHTDIIALGGGPWGELSEALQKNGEKDKERAKVIYEKYKNIFGDDYYIEITNHTYMDYGVEMRANTIEFARSVGAQMVATSNVHYVSIGDKSAHKTLIAVQGEIDSLEYYKNFFQNADFSFTSSDDAEKAFSDVPEAIANTYAIADKVNFEIELGKWVFPNIETKNGYDEDLRVLAYAGIEDRKLEKTEVLIKRLDYELEVIKNKGYSPYFLVVHDLLRFSHENGILTNIRGSVAGSLVTYLLRITACNPLEYKLPFERFLNPERPSAPDIDMDYADDRRDDVINYARSKYGVDNVAQIGTFGTMMARGAVRDVARAMKFPYIVGDRISRMIPPPKQGMPVYIDDALEEVPELKEMYDTDRETQMIIDMAKNVEGCVRHVSVHAAGTVISPAPIWEFSPIQYDPKGEGKLITQYDMYTIEDAGLLKFDFLGIRNLSILATAIQIVKEKYGVEIDIDEIPRDDKKTFDMLARGETVGLFQLNGSGMTRFLKELKPTTIFDINAMVALYRPGPLEMIPEYIKRKHNSKLVEFLDPRLEDILDQSFGVIVYQDDVMLSAIHLAGYSWLEADKLRKAMGKKIPAEMAEQKDKLLKGFVEHGLSKAIANELWHRIEPFAAYGFNKAHAASYGLVAYQTSYMKANYPYAYMTAILSHESGDVDKISEIVSECQRMNITVLPPDINYSMGGFEIVKNSEGVEEIRFGLYTIKNLGVDISDAIINERKKNGPFTTFENFLMRITHKNLNKKSIEALAMCGALDTLAERNSIIHNIEDILDYHKSVLKDNSTQESMFSIIQAPQFRLAPTTQASKTQKLEWEKDLLGLYVSGFPLDPWREKIEERGINIDTIRGSDDEKELAIAAYIEKVKITKTKKGDHMALIHVRDYTGIIEMAVFPKTYEKIKNNIKLDATVIIKGKVASRNGEKTFIVDEVRPLVNENA